MNECRLVVSQKFIFLFFLLFEKQLIKLFVFCVEKKLRVFFFFLHYDSEFVLYE